MGAAAIAAIIALGVATAANANGTVDRNLDGVSGKQLTLSLSGRVAPDCRLAGGGDINLGELRGGLEVDASLGLACNVPFDLVIRSNKGGLANLEMPGGQGPYAGTLPYTLAVSVPVMTPQTRTISADFTSDQLRGGRSVSSGDGVAFQGAQLHIATSQTTGAGLLAGRYAETIDITLQPRT